MDQPTYGRADGPTDGRTEGRTNQRTDLPPHRDARMKLDLFSSSLDPSNDLGEESPSFSILHSLIFGYGTGYERSDGPTDRRTDQRTTPHIEMGLPVRNFFFL